MSVLDTGDPGVGQADWWREAITKFKNQESKKRIAVCARLVREGKPLRSAMKEAESASRMYDASGVVEVWRGSGRIDGAVQTEEGRIVFERGTVRHREDVDVQSGPLSGWRSGIEEAGAAIRLLYDKHEPLEAVKKISVIWDRLDQTSELAAARTRILMGKINEPRLSELPKWFKKQEQALLETDEDELPPNPFAVKAAELLVRASLAALDDEDGPEADIDSGPMGRVIIDWHFLKARLQWMVDADDLPWPSIRVYQLKQQLDDGKLAAPKTRVLHNAFDAVDSFVELAAGN